MDRNQLEKLLQSKVRGARFRKLFRYLVLIAAAAVLVYAVGSAVRSGIQPSDAGPGIESAAEQTMPTAEPTSAPTTEPTPDPTPKSTSEPTPEPAPEPVTHRIRTVFLDEAEQEAGQPLKITVLHEDRFLSAFTLSPEEEWAYEWEDTYDSSELTLEGAFPDGVTASVSIRDQDFVLAISYEPAAEDVPEEAGSENQSEPTSAGSDTDASLPQAGAVRTVAPNLFLAGTALVAGYFLLRGKEGFRS